MSSPSFLQYVRLPAMSSECGPGGTYQPPRPPTALIVAAGVVVALMLLSCTNSGPSRQEISRVAKDTGADLAQADKRIPVQLSSGIADHQP
jgi:hypothetical protein